MRTLHPDATVLDHRGDGPPQRTRAELGVEALVDQELVAQAVAQGVVAQAGAAEEVELTAHAGALERSPQTPRRVGVLKRPVSSQVTATRSPCPNRTGAVGR